MEVSRLTERIRGEFLEMPGLKLTTPQACRLWNLNEAVCLEALGALVAEGFLHRTPSGAFVALPSALMMLRASLPDVTERWRCPSCQHLNSSRRDEAVHARAIAQTVRCAACGRIVIPSVASA